MGGVCIVQSDLLTCLYASQMHVDRLCGLPGQSIIKYSSSNPPSSSSSQSMFCKRYLAVPSYGKYQWICRACHAACDVQWGAGRQTHSKQYTKPPFGPYPRCSMTSSRLMRSRISIEGSYSNAPEFAAGSKFTR